MSNHIENLEITNFKSIRHQKIDGCKRINVFIGYPNVGKSAILEAISSLSYLQEDFNKDFNKLCRIKFSNELFFNGLIREPATIRINSDIKLTFQYVSEQAIKLKIQSIAFPNEMPFREITFSDGRLVSGSQTQQKNELNIRKYLFQNNFNDFKTNGLVLESPDGKNLVDIIQFNKELRKEVIDLFKANGLKLNIDQGTNSIKGFKQLDDELVVTIPFYQMAETLQRLIFHKAAILSNTDTVLLFEEPEAHMFPPYIKKFTSDIIFDQGRGNQYFISTHSPFVLNDFMEDAREDLAVYLVGMKNGETIIKRLSDEELNEVYQFGVDLFFNIESYLD